MATAGVEPVPRALWYIRPELSCGNVASMVAIFMFALRNPFWF
jgi:hypothetical protein